MLSDSILKFCPRCVLDSNENREIIYGGSIYRRSFSTG